MVFGPNQIAPLIKETTNAIPTPSRFMSEKVMINFTSEELMAMAINADASFYLTSVDSLVVAVGFPVR